MRDYDSPSAFESDSNWKYSKWSMPRDVGFSKRVYLLTFFLLIKSTFNFSSFLWIKWRWMVETNEYTSQSQNRNFIYFRFSIFGFSFEFLFLKCAVNFTSILFYLSIFCFRSETKMVTFHSLYFIVIEPQLCERVQYTKWICKYIT